MAQSLDKPLPEWLRKAIKHEVLSLEEAQAMWRLSLLSNAELVPVPEPLHPACSHIRIVTTNFDQHFTTAIKEINRDINVYYAPALPTGRAFKGLAYIHGNVEQEKEALILTDGDFG